MKTVMRILMGLFYTLAGLNHFWMPAVYVHIMPAYLPFPLLLVYLSGVLEAGLGLLVCFPRFACWAAWGLVGILILIFPANINMLLHPDLTPQIPLWVLWARLPLQLLLIGWAYYYTRPQSVANTET